MQSKVINTKIALYFLIIVAVIVLIADWFIFGQILTVGFVFKYVSGAVTIITIIGFSFCRFFWKCKLFKKWLVLIPDLNGNWEGVIESSWVNPETKEKLEPIKAELTIKQSLFHISCIMKTTEMKSQSITAGFNIVPDDQVYQMVYTYMSIPKQNIQERSRIHYGTIIFDMQNNCDCNEMTGNYWTGRNTNGFIRMEKK